MIVLDPCVSDRADPDGGCGCGRGFAGMSSRQDTSTAMVRDVEGDADVHLDAVVAHLVGLGYAQGTDDDREWHRARADDLLRWAATWPAGWILGRRLDSLHVRTRGAGAGDLDHISRRRPGR